MRNTNNAISWYSLDAVECADKLGVDASTGLSAAEAAGRQKVYGLNQLTGKKKRPVLQAFLLQYRPTMQMVLVGAAVVSALIGNFSTVWMLVGVTVLNAVLGMLQENKAERSVDALKDLLVQEAHVRRDGKVIAINEGTPDSPRNPPTFLLNDVMAGIEGTIGMLEALRRRAREGGSYLVRVTLARNCSWLQEFGLFPANEVHGAGLPESMMAAPGLNARLRPEFELPLVTSTGPLGEMSVLPPQVELSEFKLGPRFSGDPNGASKLDWSVFT